MFSTSNVSSLLISIKGGRELVLPKNSDKIYCSVSFGSFCFFTELTEGTEPLWNSSARVDLKKTNLQPPYTFSIQCRNEGNKLIGKYLEKVDSIECLPKETWYLLTNEKKKAKGLVNVSFTHETDKYELERAKLFQEKKEIRAKMEDPYRNPHYMTTSELWEEVDRVKGETRIATKRIKRELEQTKHIGITSLEKLESQGKQLNTIAGDINTTAKEVQEGEQDLKNMKHWFKAIFRRKKKTKNIIKDSELNTVEKERNFFPNPIDDCIFEEKYGKAKKYQEEQQELFGNPFGEPIEDRKIGKFEDTETFDLEKEEAEMNRELSDMSFLLRDLKNMALDMNQEIASQTSKWDVIASKTEDLNDKIQKQTKYMQKI